ncbi:MAG TPA: hypothetical protein DCZ01_05255 [Elusimicrobia bacterium]|nr:MAG: hypothetical protein A2X37_08400 [Elusimicrobia bacterium GWA2_66_18]HAZ07930.1 hypothetical protein [Elusimicrobiota bacterium]
MRKTARALLALALVGPGPSWAQSVVAPAVRTPAGAVAVAAAAAAATPSLGAKPLLLPNLPAPAPGLALSPAAAAAGAGRPDALNGAKPPRTALEGLKTELDALPPEPFDLAGIREQAALSFDAKLGVETFVHLGRVQTPPPAQTRDDGGGPTHSRLVAFNGENFPSVAFRPNEPVETHIVHAIESSRKSIQISLYEFTSRAILKALLAARQRGVKVEIILDDTSVNPRNEPDAEYNRYRSEQIWALIRNGLDVTVIGRPTMYGINHHKFAVFDGKMAEFGSYNWTYTSENSHYENVLFSTDADRVKAYQAAWAHLRALSVSVAESATHEWPLDVSAPPSDARKRISFNGTRLPAWVFNPSSEFEDSIAAAIDASKVSIDVAQFVLESRKIADALARALARGVKIRVVVDKSQAAYDHVQIFLGWLSRRGAAIRTLSGPNGDESDYPLAEKMHNKYFVFDGKLVETGSGNATKNAGINNFENANFIDEATDVKAFASTFQHLFDVGQPLAAMPVGELPTDAQLRESALKPRGPPAPPEPGPDPLPAARRIAFNGVDYPVSALRPNEPVEPLIIQAIDSARATLRIAIYELNQQGVFDALRRARKRGVKIQIVLDRSHVYTTGHEDDGVTPRKPKPMVVDLIKDGFDVLLLKGRLGGIMHNKFIVVDEGLAQFGSYNYTQQSEDDHYENVFFSIEKGRVTGYLRYFDYMRGLSEEPELEKLDEIVNLAEAALLDDDPVDAVRKHPPLPDPPRETETPISFNNENFPLQMFSPNAGIERALIRAIEASRLSIDIAMFSFFSRPIAEALLRAKDRGVKVSIVMDRTQAGISRLDDWFAWHGFDLRVISGPNRARDPRYQKMHNKFALFDGKMLESGSFNYSARAEMLNFENANFFDDADEIARYAACFVQMFARGTAPKPPKREPQWAAPAFAPQA